MFPKSKGAARGFREFKLSIKGISINTKKRQKYVEDNALVNDILFWLNLLNAREIRGLCKSKGINLLLIMLLTCKRKYCNIPHASHTVKKGPKFARVP